MGLLLQHPSLAIHGVGAGLLRWLQLAVTGGLVTSDGCAVFVLLVLLVLTAAINHPGATGGRGTFGTWQDSNTATHGC